MPIKEKPYVPSNTPKFLDWKRTDDGVMVADIGFKKQLWALDPELDVVWDCGARKWEIWKFPGQAKKPKKFFDHKAYHIMTIQTKGRTFRELGADVILKLQMFNPERWTAKQLADYFDKMDDNIMRAKEKDFKNYINDIAMDTFDFVRGVLKVQVPEKIKPSEEKYLLKVSQPKLNKYILKVPKAKKIEHAIAGGVDG